MKQPLKARAAHASNVSIGSQSRVRRRRTVKAKNNEAISAESNTVSLEPVKPAAVVTAFASATTSTV